MRNVGGIDRLFRFALSIPFLFILNYVDGNWRFIGLIGIVKNAKAHNHDRLWTFAFW